MKKLSLKAIAVAAGALIHGMAFATIDLDSSSAVAAKFASEITVSSTATVALTNTATILSTTVATGATLPLNAVAYIRYDLSSGTFTANPTLTVTDSAGTATAAVAQGGAGASFVIFSVTPSAPTASLTSAGAVVLAPGSITVGSQATVSQTYKLFETLTNAANNVNPLKTATKDIIAFQQGLTTTITGGTLTASVNASPAYTAFTSSTTPLATLVIAETASTFKAAGTAVTDGDVFASGVISVAGDFSFAQNDAGTYTGAALNRVFLSTSSTCATVDAAATSLSAAAAGFASITGSSLAATRYLCVTPEGTPAINAGSYVASIDYTAGAGYTVSDVAAAAAGSIVRDGVTLVAPLVQTTTGYVTRLVLTNNGTVERAYTISGLSETGTTVALNGALASGTLAANSTKVIEISSPAITNSLFTGTGFTGSARGSLVVTVNAPLSAIDGLYQIVNPAGGVSNYLLRK